VPGAVDVRVVAVLRLVLDVRRRDRDAARLLLRSLVDLVVGREGGAARLGQTLVIAAVSDVLPWSTWPIVPMLQCGLLRSNFDLAMTASTF
jgi:hypothetical protein